MGKEFKVYSFQEAIEAMGQTFSTISEETVTKAKIALQTLATQTHAMILKKAQTELKSTRERYSNALKLEQISESVWVVSLDPKANWIEEGYERHEMIDKLTGGPKARTSKDGHKYNIIPFEHSKPPSQMSAAQLRISAYVKAELKRQNLDKTIMTPGGKPVIGRAATVDLTGKGSPVGKFNQPLLKGLTIYQREVVNKKGESQIKRDVFTFRVVSTKQKGSGMWYNHGYKGAHFFDHAVQEVDKIWKDMVQDVLKK